MVWLLLLASNVTAKSAVSCLVNEEQYPCQVLKKDINQNLALLKIDKDKLSTSGFFNYEKMEIGKRIYLLYYLASGELSVNEGIVKSFDSDLIKTNIREVEAVMAVQFSVLITRLLVWPLKMPMALFL